MRNKYILWFFALVLSGLILWYLSHIVIYIIVAAIISLIGQPINRFYSVKLKFGKFTLSPTLSASLTLLTMFLAFALIAGIFTPLVMEEVRIISSLDKDAITTSLQQPIQLTETILHDFNIDFESADFVAYVQEKVISVFTITNISLIINQFFNIMGSFLISLFSISFLTFFFLRDQQLIIESIFSLVPERYTEKGRRVWLESEELLKRYFTGVLVEVLLVVLFLFIGLWLCGIKHALLIAVFAGLMNIIPYVGPFIGCGFALLIGLTTNTNMSLIATVTRILIVFPIVNLTDAFLLQPMIYSNSVKAHPLEIFIVLLVGSTIGGIGGMILAVPGYTVMRLFLKELYIHFKNTRQ